MTTMNRLYELNTEHKAAARINGYEWSFDSMRSSKEKLKRGNCVLDIVCGLEI